VGLARQKLMHSWVVLKFWYPSALEFRGYPTDSRARSGAEGGGGGGGGLGGGEGEGEGGGQGGWRRCWAGGAGRLGLGTDPMSPLVNPAYSRILPHFEKQLQTATEATGGREVAGTKPHRHKLRAPHKPLLAPMAALRGEQYSCAMQSEALLPCRGEARRR